MKRGLLWLMAGFLGNGLAQFLQRYLHAAGLGAYQASALVAMYAAGAVFAAALLAGFRGRVGRAEIIAGAGLGLFSYLGNFAVLRALGHLPAYTVFPIVVGGPILLVAVVARLFFAERLSRTLQWGIACGVAAVVLLTCG